jgi:threonine dehydratase
MDSNETTIDGIRIPDADAIGKLRADLQPYIKRTPVFERNDFPAVAGTTLQFKFELLQVSGTFKARGAFANMLALDAAARRAGVTCISSGNHAVAVAYVAMRLGIGAKVVMLKTSSPGRSGGSRRSPGASAVPCSEHRGPVVWRASWPLTSRRCDG